MAPTDLLPFGLSFIMRVPVLHSASAGSVVAGDRRSWSGLRSRSPAARRVAASGVRPPWAECGRTWLESCRQRSMTARASARLANTSSFKHSSRKRPLKPSAKAFWVGALPDQQMPGPMQHENALCPDNTVKPHSAIGNLVPALYATLNAPARQREGALGLYRGSTSLPVASTAQAISNEQGTLLIAG